MAARCPFAVWKPLGPQTQARMRSHDLVLLHTMVGYLYSTDTYFRSSNGYGYAGTESHYGVGGRWGSDASRGLDGAIWQWQDRAYMADANGQANPRAISVETADSATAPIVPWSDAQCEAIAQIVAWESTPAAHADCPSSWTCHQQGIPLELIPDSKPGRRGIGYHRQGIDPWRVAGGEVWSTAYGKVCPDSARIAQIPGIIARARQIVAGGDYGPAPVGPTEHDRRVQELLSVLLDPDTGEPYYQGALDGINGGVQQQAVRDYQEDAGLPVTGSWDAATESYYREHDVVTQADRDAIARSVLDSLRPLLDSIVGEAQRAASEARAGLSVSRELLSSLQLHDADDAGRVRAVVAQLDDMQARMPRVNTARYDNVAVASYAELQQTAETRGMTYLHLSGQLDGVRATVSDDDVLRIAEASAELVAARESDRG